MVKTPLYKKSIAEQRAARDKKRSFKAVDIAKHLDVSVSVVLRAARTLDVRGLTFSRFSKGQAARLILHIRQQQGSKILQAAEKKLSQPT